MPFAPEQFAELTPLEPATGAIFTRMALGAFVDWHNAPHRQYVITLVGGVEIGWAAVPCISSDRAREFSRRT